MIYLELFLVFLEIGAVSFGGGIAMFSLMRERAIMYGWLTEGEVLQFMAIAESTPGPIAVNMATFVGSSQGGILGALCATLGIVLPSFIIILIIAALLKNFLKYRAVDAVMSGVRPAVVALITSTGILLLLSGVFGISSFKSEFAFDYKAAIIIALLAVLAYVFQRLKKKSISPIALILVSAGLGALFYSI